MADINHNGKIEGVDFPAKINVFPDQSRENGVDLADDVVQFCRLRVEGLLPAECQEVFCEIRGPLRSKHDAVHIFPGGCVTGCLELEKVSVADDCGENVVEIVGDASGKLADCVHLLQVLKLGFKFAVAGNVTGNSHDSNDRSIFRRKPGPRVCP